MCVVCAASYFDTPHFVIANFSANGALPSTTPMVAPSKLRKGCSEVKGVVYSEEDDKAKAKANHMIALT